MDEDKPFACMVPDCGMKFINEDHLVVHQKKHELSLSLTPSAFKTSFYDQTPTPTRFLNAFESELFQDLQSDNPFDVTFRRANSMSESSSITLPESSNLISSLPDTEPLSTPSIMFTNEADIQLFASRRRSGALALRSPAKRKEEKCSKELEASPSETLPFESTVHEVPDEDEVNSLDEDRSITILVDEASNMEEEDPSLSIDQGSVVQTPVITSVGNLAKACTTGVPTAVVKRTAMSDVPSLSSSVSQMSVSTKVPTQPINEITAPVVQSVTVAPVVQLIIRLPDGQSMPVQFPVVSTTPAQTAQPIKSVASISPKATTSSSLAKLKLKQVLTSSQKNASQNGITSTNRVSRLNVSPSFEGRLSESPSSPINLHRPGSTGRRRRDLDDDPEEKRRKSLERNRAAATRCRQKRKQWIQTLGSKADELAATNSQLQHEVTMLRNEVAQLKTMLLAHKNCPVTQQQKESGDYGEMVFVETMPTVTFQPRTRNVSCVPIIQSMDMETSSSQSGSVSDTSEVSMKD